MISKENVLEYCWDVLSTLEYSILQICFGMNISCTENHKFFKLNSASTSNWFENKMKRQCRT